MAGVEAAVRGNGGASDTQKGDEMTERAIAAEDKRAEDFMKLADAKHKKAIAQATLS